MRWLDPEQALPAWRTAATATIAEGQVTVADLSLFRFGPATVAVDSETGGWAVLDAAEAESLTKGGTTSEFGREWIQAAWRRGLIRVAGQHVLSGTDLLAEAAACRDTYGLVLLLNAGCNLVCTYCYLGHETPSRHRGLDPETARAAIRSALRRPERQIIVDVGEIAAAGPLWQPLIAYVRELTVDDERDIRVTIQTNGTTLDESTVTFLAENRVTVGLSIDGPADLHDRARVFRNGKGSHRQAAAAIRRCTDAGVALHLIATVARHNIGEPERVVGEILAHQPDSYLLKPVLAHGEAATAWDREGVTSDEFATFMSRAITSALSLGGELDQSATKFARRLLGDPQGWADGCTSRACGSGRSLHVVGSDGELFACPRFVTKGTGHRDPGDLADGRATLPLLLAPELRALPKSCSRCPWLRSCGGGCTLSGHDGIGGTAPLPDPQCTAYQEIHRTLVERLLLEAVGGRAERGPATRSRIREVLPKVAT